jgi:hypothetical protein
MAEAVTEAITRKQLIDRLNEDLALTAPRSALTPDGPPPRRAAHRRVRPRPQPSSRGPMSREQTAVPGQAAGNARAPANSARRACQRS